MATEVLLPKQGNTVESCIIIEWKKAVGDAVKTGEAIAEVETDKATLDVEANADGVLLAQLVSEGDDVPVLTPIAVIGEEGEEVPETAPTEKSGDAGTGAESRAPEAPQEAEKPSSRTPASEADDEPPVHDRKAAAAGGSRERERVAISPRARRLAEKHGVAFAGAQGSGPGGRLMVKDIERLIEAGEPSMHGREVAAAGSSRRETVGEAAPDREGREPDVEEKKITGVRKVIAERMHASLANKAQLTMSSSADARRLMEYRKRLKASGDGEMGRISINDLVLFAVSRTLPAFRFMNATYQDGVVRSYGAVHLGFAVDTERGLMVPVIRDADRRSLASISAEAHRLAEACLAAKAKPEDLSGATFTITNLGALGIESFTPVLNPPQVGILGVCSIAPKPLATESGTEFVPHVGLSLTIDHQVVDGAPAARFLSALAETISHIDTALAR